MAGKGMKPSLKLYQMVKLQKYELFRDKSGKICVRMYTENYKTLLREIKDLHKCTDNLFMKIQQC